MTPPEPVRVDLTNCDREPIHILGQVQPFGCLLALNMAMELRYASENTKEVLGIDPSDAFGQPLTSFFPQQLVHDIRTRSQMIRIDQSQSRLFGAEPFGDGRIFDLSLHLSGDLFLLEFEPKTETTSRDEMALVTPMIARIRNKPDIETAAQETTRALQMLSGFDRVMVYRFEDDGTGEVLAETCAPGMDPYLGLKYPASDIPQQARALYTRSLLRLIADVDAKTSAIIAHPEERNGPLDLSLAVTRAVSPIHLEYLRNMGVAASMSVSIMVNDRLWGLIACHHREPRYIDYERRTAIEMMGQFLSYEFSAKTERSLRSAEAEARTKLDGLVKRLSHSKDLIEAADDINAALPQVIACDGLAVRSGGETRLFGKTPVRDQIVALCEVLSQNEQSEVFQTNALSQFHPDAEDYADAAAGLLAMPISRSPKDYILLFRQEAVRSVSWAGNPDKKVLSGPFGDRLHPRESFAEWKETVRNTSIPWSGADIRAAEAFRTNLVEIVLRLTDTANEIQRQLSARQEVLIAELNHRVRNILNLIQGLVSQSRRNANDIGRYTEVLDGRVHALARAHDQLTERLWEPAPLRELIDIEMQAFAGGASGQVSVSGAAPALKPEAFTTLSLVIHELTTNSVKYGALSTTAGSVEIELAILDDGDLQIRWKERGGPPVSAPERQGFGTTIISRTIPHELNGAAELAFEPDGLKAILRVPAAHVPTDETHQAKTDQKPEPELRTAAIPTAVLLVEDNMIIALDSLDMLQAQGVKHVHLASNVTEALEIVAKHDLDFAVLDVNLGATNSLPIAQELSKRDISFVLATGYGKTDGLLADFPDSPVLRKPYTSDALVAAITSKPK